MKTVTFKVKQTPRRTFKISRTASEEQEVTTPSSFILYTTFIDNISLCVEEDEGEVAYFVILNSESIEVSQETYETLKSEMETT